MKLKENEIIIPDFFIFQRTVPKYFTYRAKFEVNIDTDFYFLYFLNSLNISCSGERVYCISLIFFCSCSNSYLLKNNCQLE